LWLLIGNEPFRLRGDDRLKIEMHLRRFPPPWSFEG
jgi:hypothetical protein